MFSPAFQSHHPQLAVSEDEVMMPHAFERLWGAFEPQGEFQTHITEAVPQTTVVRHLNDRGFQVRANQLFNSRAEQAMNETVHKNPTLISIQPSLEVMDFVVLRGR